MVPPSKHQSLARVTLFFLLLLPTLARAATEEPMMPEDDFSPMGFLFVLIALGLTLCLIGVGIVAALVAAISLAALVGLGVISTASVVGLLRRRLSSGLRAFHYQACALAGIPAGVAALWIWASVFDSWLSAGQIVLLGALAGAMSGLVLAYALDRIAGVALRRFTSLVIEPQPHHPPQITE